jgi:hypothetical protein
MSVRLYICTSVRLYVCTSVRLYVCTSVRLYVCTSVVTNICHCCCLLLLLSVNTVICYYIYATVCVMRNLNGCSLTHRPKHARALQMRAYHEQTLTVS